MSEKQGLPMDNSLRSDNSIGRPKGHTRSLKFYYSSSEVTRTAPSPAPVCACAHLIRGIFALQ